MTKVILVKFHIKDGKKQKWIDWTEELKKRKTEVLETMEDEKMQSEAIFISGDGQDIFWFMESDDFQQTENSYKNSKHLLDDEHKKMREECLEFIEFLDPLTFFSRKD